ncbi:hypothetical protein MPTK1_2g23920 [Marchantia polymorpha subsp. ruderalis]|nr:hypothetical protein MARPO_0276s0001 [Marchantia polymorpha]BBN03490.1 hypothetical protein Mp_2g23920 [Marchantia polymorpha subsp. ruderalis]PTQ35697.1 hypothetical protein MARPO_0069s0042 [Marchantia polymorpha]PTQ35698.1 hypothetical protein MARPO_0069s0042 [Marchantia polymorpha]BBN03491.1 hypothetical protein Mp_2g23920 [Marchantia polymorpha subsp. ruderalis]|eukprot:PTQ26897.1 hypothetical protein MARPO_0276s0001 [Marchantia polymorpha]
MSICGGPSALSCCNAAARPRERNVGPHRAPRVRCSAIVSSRPRVRIKGGFSSTFLCNGWFGRASAAESAASSSAAVVGARRPSRRGVFELDGDSDDEDEEFDEDWESDIFEDFDRPEGEVGRARKAGVSGNGESRSAGEREEKVDDWAEKARQRAILSIQARGLPVAALVDERPKKKKKKRSKKKVQGVDVKVEKSVRAEFDPKVVAPPPAYVDPPLDSPFLAAFGSGEGLKELAGLGNYWKSLGQAGEIRIQEDVRPKEVELLIEENSGLVRPGPMSGFPKGSPGKTSKQRRQDDFDLNRSLVEASNAEEVLSLVGSVLESRAGVQDNDLLSPTNVSTALHRIAKHMEREATHKSDRLSFARKRTMALLVSAATESLSQCSAQSISNIAWALSKVGGSSLYWAEMDLLAEAALSKISDLQSQHIANIAGAFASMQHSLPYLFDALDQRACLLYHTFQPQELAQFLWAFATLNEPAKRLLDLLDSECENSEQSNEERISRSTPGSGELSSNWTSAESHFAKFTLSELSSLSWSYTVLNELSRPSFALIWSLIVKMSQGNAKHFQVLSGQTMQLSQLHQVTLSLELEYPELDLLPGEPLRSMAESEWEKLKIGKKSTSTTQRDVEILLTSTGRQWVGEYSAASHSLDAALVEERIALEIDGPTHFARNTGRALGHTVLKRRQLSAAGWIVLSIPYQEWDELLGEAEQLEYLRDLLKQHL